MLALFLAVLMMFSGMAVSASAASVATPDTPAVQVPTSINAPTLTKSDADKTITVKLPVVNGFKVNILVEPSASYVDLNNGSYLYVNLTPGQTYSFKAYIVKSDNTLLYSPAATAMIKDKLAVPSAPVASKVTSTSITVTKVTGCEYRLTDEKGNVVKSYNWSDKTVVFEGLTQNTKYVLSIRKKETSTKYASDPVSVTVRTLKAGDKTAVGTPVLVDKTNTTVTVKCAAEDEGKKIEFSIDKGKTWQYSGEFKNLTPNTIYGVIARKAYDPAVQDPNPSSKILEFRTNSKARVEASLADCTVTFTGDKIYANVGNEVLVTGDGPDDLYLAEFGDSRFIPSEIYFDANGARFPITDGKAEVEPGSARANSKATMYVVFKVERYNGGGEWKADGTITMEKEIEVGSNRNFFTIIGEFFVSVFNFLFDTLPEMILGTGDLWEGGLALLFGMFDDIGLTK